MTTTTSAATIVILQPAWVSVFGIAWIVFLLALFVGGVFSVVWPMQAVLVVGALVTVAAGVVGLGVRLRRDGEALVLEHGRAGWWREQQRWVSSSIAVSARPYVSKSGKDRYWIVDVEAGSDAVSLATRTEATAKAAVGLVVPCVRSFKESQADEVKSTI
jgi:hypothetical protein